MNLVRFARCLGLGRLELAVPHNKKSLDKDPKLYESLIYEDKRSHQGAFRIGHLLCIEEGIVQLHRQAESIKHPIFLQQGGQDRVACHPGSVSWIRRITSTDKRMSIYPVCQHVIYQKARTEEEDLAGRVACIEDNVEWMTERLAAAASPLLDLSLDNMSYFFGNKSISSYDASESSQSSTPTSTSPLTPCFSELEDQSGYSSPDMMEVTPCMLPTPNCKEPTILQFQEYDANTVIDHPLLANAHESTLPALVKLAPLRAYRTHWTLSEQLRPYDITVAGSSEDDEIVTSGCSRA